MKVISYRFPVRGAINDKVLLLGWINWQISFEICWQTIKPGRLLALNPQLLRRMA